MSLFVFGDDVGSNRGLVRVHLRIDAIIYTKKKKKKSEPSRTRKARRAFVSFSLVCFLFFIHQSAAINTFRAMGNETMASNKPVAGD